MEAIEHTYYLIYREVGKNEGELLFNVGGTDRRLALIKLRGRIVRDIFDGIIQTLGVVGGAIPIQTGEPKIYAIRDDIGPVIGTYLVLIMRARKIDYWMKFLDELLIGKYSRLGGAFALLLQIMTDLSRGAPKTRKYGLSPAITSSFSQALKVLVKALEKYAKLER